jgi:hypothetical protein
MPGSRTFPICGNAKSLTNFSSYYRCVNFANATPGELENLAQACAPASFGMNKKEVLDESYRKAGKMELDCFSSSLDPMETGLVKIVRNYLLEGTQARNHVVAKLHKLNVYSTHSILFWLIARD